MSGKQLAEGDHVLAPLIGGEVLEKTKAKDASHSQRKLADGKGKKNEPAPAEGPKKKSYKDLINRTIFTILMAYVFLAAISLGIVFGIPLVTTILVTMFHEVTRINQRLRKERQIPSIHIIKWYYLVTATAYVLFYNLRVPIENAFPAAMPFFDKLPFIGFSLWMLGIVGFVLSLKKGMYRYQFIQFTWAVMTLMFIVTQCAAEVRNMMRGMIWFLLPVSCVVNNDIWAFMFGKLFGRTKLLSLSPKKTVEGFIGAFLFTVAWSFWFCGFLGYFPEMHCPAVGFTNAVNSKCEMDPVFVQREVALPEWVQSLSGGHLSSILVSPAQKHAIVLGIFASLVAPFGGFFASGLKRAFKLKDFGDLIPGHGGMTDRMDCQGIMGLFTYFYLRTYLYSAERCPATLDGLSRCAMRLSANQRQELLSRLVESLQPPTS